MVYYFSGTGNSRYVARKVSSALDSGMELILENIVPTLQDDVLGLVFPVYAWGIPDIVRRFIKKLRVGKPDIYVFAIMTCGDETGDAPRMLKKDLSASGIRLDSLYSVIMPNTYVLLPGFDTDEQSVVERKLESAEKRISYIISALKDHRREEDVFKGGLPYLKTALFYPLFSKWGIIRKYWRHTSGCDLCGKCIISCPVGNISKGSSLPVYGDKCQSCLACYHNCPRKAIRYGAFSEGKGQYTCPLK